MKLFERLFGERLEPRWEVSPGAMIWKILVTGAGILLGESRDPERHEMSLFAVDLAAGRLLYSNARLDVAWWIALEMAIGDIGILHLFPKPDMPHALGVVAVDARTGATLWSDPALRVICGTTEIALAQRGAAIEEGELFFLDARTGAVLESTSTERAREFQVTCAAATDWSGWTASEDLGETHPRFAQLRSLVDREAGDARGVIEWAEHGEFTVLSAYVPSRVGADAALNNQLDNILLVVRNGRVLWRDTLATGVRQPTSDVFFILHGVLYTIRDRRTLVAIDLNSIKGEA